MEEMFSRTAMLLGEEAIKKLATARVAVFGVGGVGVSPPPPDFLPIT